MTAAKEQLNLLATIWSDLNDRQRKAITSVLTGK